MNREIAYEAGYEWLQLLGVHGPCLSTLVQILVFFR